MLIIVRHRQIYLNCRTGRFEAHIWQEGKQIYLGGFDAEEQAALAYDLAALKFRGVDAQTNYDKSTYEQEMLQFNEVHPCHDLVHEAVAGTACAILKAVESLLFTSGQLERSFSSRPAALPFARTTAKVHSEGGPQRYSTARGRYRRGGLQYGQKQGVL